jgi:hypothetical protein
MQHEHKTAKQLTRLVSAGVSQTGGQTAGLGAGSFALLVAEPLREPLPAAEVVLLQD